MSAGNVAADVNTPTTLRAVKRKMEVNISFRVRKELRDEAQARAQEQEENVSDILREALERYVKKGKL